MPQPCKNSVQSLGLVLSFLSLFSLSSISFAAVPADAKNLRVYMEQVIGAQAGRHAKNIQELNRVSAWIREQMRLFGVPCQYQNYTANSLPYRNVVCSLNAGKKQKVIVGAHYDVLEDTTGADDNASGVAGVIEVARILATEKTSLKHNVDFVFYTLAEPPYFGTENMGSFIHAKSVAKQKQNIAGVYILEMIGYFDENEVQQYPAGLKWIYPAHGNFIAAVGNLVSRDLTYDYCAAMRKLNQLQCERLIAPSFMQDLDFSDHLNYWKFGFPAITITDTAMYRNKYYHTRQDTLDRLDTEKMGQVVNGVVKMLLN